MDKKIALDEKIFIAGARGMAGSAIYRSLIKYGYGNAEHNGKILAPTRKELNLLDLNAVIAWFKKNKPTVVIVAAAKVGGILANSTFPADFLITNLKIQTNIIETAWLYGVKRLLFIGSSCIYPKLSNQPIKEEYLMTSSLEPTNEGYAIAKIAGLKLCKALRMQYDFDAISIMPTNLYGPGDNYDSSNSHVMAALLRKFYEAKANNSSVICWGSGKQLREFMHVDDLGEAVTFVLEYWDPSSFGAPKNDNGESLLFLNVGTGKDLTIKNLSEKIANAIGFKGDIKWDLSKPDGTPRKLLDVSRINKLGWKANITLDDGIRETVKNLSSEIKRFNKRN